MTDRLALARREAAAEGWSAPRIVRRGPMNVPGPDWTGKPR